jgi:hypothetical protein
MNYENNQVGLAHCVSYCQHGNFVPESSILASSLFLADQRRTGHYLAIIDLGRRIHLGIRSLVSGKAREKKVIHY